MSVTCPKCGEVLPPAFSRPSPPRTGEELECGLCGNTWRFRLPAPSETPSDELSTDIALDRMRRGFDALAGGLPR